MNYVIVIAPCHAPVPGGGFNICTREVGHKGEHRCSAADVDARRRRLNAVVDAAISALRECEVYFDERADAHFTGKRHIGNREMQLLGEVREAIATLEAQQLRLA